MKPRRSPRRVPGTNNEWLEDCEVGDRPEPAEPVKAPEPVKRVRVLDPFSVSYQGISHWPNEVAEVPASVADKWLRSQWVVDDASD